MLFITLAAMFIPLIPSSTSQTLLATPVSATTTTMTFGKGSDGRNRPQLVLQAVADAIRTQGLPLTVPTNPFLRSREGTGKGLRWNDNGTQDTATLFKICDTLGYRTYVSSTCQDEERSSLYPNGKCNFHTPRNNKLTRYSSSNFNTVAALPKYGSTWVASITCADPFSDGSSSASSNISSLSPSENPQCSNGIDDDRDGATDFPYDFSCTTVLDTDEANPKAQCQDGMDNDGNGLVDFPADPGCTSAQDSTEMGASMSSSSNNSSSSSVPVSGGDGACQYPVRSLEQAGLTSATIRELTTDFTEYSFTLGQLQTMSATFSTSAHEQYTIFISDAGGHADPQGSYINILDYRNENVPDQGAGNNIDAITLHFSNGTSATADRVSNVQLGTGLSNLYITNLGYASRALGAPDDQVTYLGNQNADLTLGFCTALAAGTSSSSNSSSSSSSSILPQCSNGIDDDNDGATDFPADFSCTSALSTNEANPKSQCQDGIDNDGNGLVDYPADPGCTGAQDNTETGASSSSSSSNSSSPDPGGNLIPNPSVETDGGNGDPAHWHRGGWGTNTVQYTYPGEAEDGSRGAALTITQYTNGDAKWYFDNVPVTPGQQYSFSDWYKSTAPSSLVVQYTMQDTAQQYVEIGQVGPSTDFRQFSTTFTAPANAASLTVFHLLAAAGTLSVDNFSLTLFSGGPGPDSFDKGYVSLTFDDGWISHYTTVRPILDQSSLKASFYIITNEMLNPAAGDLNDPSSYASTAQVLALQQAGHEIDAHTQTHPHLTQLTTAKARDEIQGSRKDLLDHGFSPVDSLAYTYGEYNDAIITLTKNANFAGARTVDEGYNQRTDNTFTLKVQNVLNTTTPAQIRQWIDTATRDKTWLILVIHQVINNPGQYDTSPATLQDTVNYLKAQSTPVITVHQGLQMMP